MADSKEDDDGLSGAADFVQIYMIQCDIIAGHDLIKADVLGKSDPYVIVQAFSRTYTTATKMKTLNPEWNEKVEMTFFNDPKKLKFQVMDWDKNTPDDPIGDCEFVFPDDMYSPSNNGFHGKLKLEHVKKGQLEIKVVARKLVPSELQNKLTSLTDTLEQNAKTMEGLMEEIADFGQKNAALDGEIEGLQTKVDELNAVIPQRKEELDKLKQEGDELDTEEKELSAEVEPLKGTLAELEEELNGIKKQIEDVQVEEDKKHSEIEMMQTKDENKAGNPKEEESLLENESDKNVPTGRDDGCKCCKCVVL